MAISITKEGRYVCSCGNTSILKAQRQGTVYRMHITKGDTDEFGNTYFYWKRVTHLDAHISHVFKAYIRLSSRNYIIFCNKCPESIIEY